MKVAVVMSTFNGEKYIIEQLDSIRKQTRQPDFVVIGDDCSTDSTVKIINGYIKKYCLNNWFLKVNEGNLGWKKNFFKLIDDCSADIIFLSDQDDIWHNKKIELMLNAMDNISINVLACKYIQTNKVYDMNYIVNDTSVVKPIFFNHKYNYVTHVGCAYCFRKTYFNSIKQYWREFLPHDAFLFRNAMLDDTLYEIDAQLLFHRWHSNNASSYDFKALKNSIGYYNNVVELLQMYLSDNSTIMDYNKKMDILNAAHNWLALRKRFYETKNILLFVKLIKYYKFYFRFSNFIKDIFIAFA